MDPQHKLEAQYEQPINPNNYQRVDSSRRPRNDYFYWSVFNMFCCCWQFAIPAMIYALLARDKHRSGDVQGGEHYTKRAYHFNVLATVMGATALVFCVVFMMWNLAIVVQMMNQIQQQHELKNRPSV